MINKFLVAGLLATALVVPAAAQMAKQAQPTTAHEMQAMHSDMWRSSKLIGVNVYNDKNEKLGDISELLLDKSGKVAGVVIGVGGFLGMGEHDIMVEMSKLKFVDEPVRTATNDKPAATTGSNAANKIHDHWYPDHAVLAGATKDSLKAMEQFKY